MHRQHRQHWRTTNHSATAAAAATATFRCHCRFRRRRFHWSANMNPPNILGEPPVQDEDMNPDEQPVEGEESSLSGHSTTV